MSIVYVLTREINDYDQDGEYFVAVFSDIPKAAKLISLGVPQNKLRHVMNGGGRLEYDQEWFWLREQTLN